MTSQTKFLLPDRPGRWLFEWAGGGRRIVFWIMKPGSGNGEALEIVSADTPEDAPAAPMSIREFSAWDVDELPLGQWLGRVGELPPPDPI